uniref:Uncharacterized protein n=1 Tax=viral metagenome TaxID=1070528 RepID=A0A6H1ZQQ4_9ZZZZ
MVRKKSVKTSIRFKGDNYRVVRDVADGLFWGDFSKAANFVVESFRHRSEYVKLLELVGCMADYNRGVRTGRVIRGKKNLEVLMLAMTKDKLAVKRKP